MKYIIVFLFSFLSFFHITSADDVLRIEGVDVIDNQTLEFEFSTALSTDIDSKREFIIENSVTKEELKVEVSEVFAEDPNKVFIILEDVLLSNTQYNVIVLELLDAKWNNIESWIDGLITFVTPTFSVNGFISNPGTVTSNIIEKDNKDESGEEKILEDEQEVMIPQEENLSLNAAPEENQILVSPLWTETSQENVDITKWVIQTANTTTALPQTWPEHWLLLFISIIMTSGLIYKQKKKNS